MNENILDAELAVVKRIGRFTRFRGLFFDYLSIGLMFPFLLAPFLGIMWLIEEYMSYGCFVFYLAIYITLVLQKDVLNGMSLGKRKVGLQIIDIDTNKKASSFKCVLRNSLVFIFPLEILISLFLPERKLGDFIAGTKLVLHATVSLSETKKEFKVHDKIELLKSFTLVFFVTLLLIYLITFLFPLDNTFFSR
jgi:hypothetical protein